MKEIVGYEGKYAVDSEGIVYSLNYRRTGKTKALKALCLKICYTVCIANPHALSWGVKFHNSYHTLRNDNYT